MRTVRFRFESHSQPLPYSLTCMLKCWITFTRNMIDGEKMVSKSLRCVLRRRWFGYFGIYVPRLNPSMPLMYKGTTGLLVCYPQTAAAQLLLLHLYIIQKDAFQTASPSLCPKNLKRASFGKSWLPCVVRWYPSSGGLCANARVLEEYHPLLNAKRDREIQKEVVKRSPVSARQLPS